MTDTDEEIWTHLPEQTVHWPLNQAIQRTSSSGPGAFVTVSQEEAQRRYDALETLVVVHDHRGMHNWQVMWPGKTAQAHHDRGTRKLHEFVERCKGWGYSWMYCKYDPTYEWPKKS